MLKNATITTRIFLSTFAAAVAITIAATSAAADQCHPGKYDPAPLRSKALPSFSPPAVSKNKPPMTLSPGVQPELILDGGATGASLYVKTMKRLDAEAPAKIEAAKQALLDNTIEKYKRASVLRLGASAAKRLDDDNSYIAFSEKLIALLPDYFGSYEKNQLAHAYMRIGAQQKAYTMFKDWFADSEFVRLKDLEAMAQAAESSGAYEDAILYLGCQLLSKPIQSRQENAVILKKFQLSAKHGEITKIQNSVKEFSEFLESRSMKKQILTKAKYYELGAAFLRDAGYQELSSEMTKNNANKKLTRLQKALRKESTECEKGQAQACLALGEIYKYETYFRTERFEANKQACALGAQSGCVRAATSYQYGIGVPEDKDLAHDLFRKACEENIGEACQGAALKYLPTLNGLKTRGGDMQKARSFHSMGCELDYAKSCFSLGNSYRKPKDKTTKADPDKALIYFTKSCKLGEKWACKRAKTLKAELR